MKSLSPRLQHLVPLSDEEVVVRVNAGDTGAFELLMRRHNQRLFRLARSVVREDAAAEDVVQEAYVRAFAGLQRFRGEASVVTWLSRIAWHEALRVRRVQRRAPRDVCRDSLECAPIVRGVAPSEQIERGEQRAALGTAIDGLAAKQRAVVMLRLVEELSTRETAASLRLSESDVKVTLHRAKQQLADSLVRAGLSDLRSETAFAGDRCDRVVARVHARIRA